MKREISPPSSSPNPPCPWLPAIESRHDHSITRRHGSSRGPEFYFDALCYAQSQWIHRKPAQAILQLNKAWLADLTDRDQILATRPTPYRALIWILDKSASGDCGYFGNPVRHFQHLATRVSGPRAEIRSWRAWACFHLAENILQGGGFARDSIQIAREGVWIPGWSATLARIDKHGWPGEAEAIRDAIRAMQCI